MRSLLFTCFLLAVLAAVSFSVNLPPTIPVPISPIDSEVVDQIQPIFFIYNSTDPDMDAFWYNFTVYDKDSALPNGPIFGNMISPQADSTGWQSPEPLVDNWILFWKVQACDMFFNCSEWTEEQVFWINTGEDAPYPFMATYPPDTGYSYVTDMLETFRWQKCIEFDPFDSVYYTLYIATDSEFIDVVTYDSLWNFEFVLPDSLEFGMQYWWKVKATDNAALFVYSTNRPDFMTWMLGDADGSRMVNILDVVFLINYLYKDGREPYPPIMGDIDGDCVINIMDATYLVDYLYKGGPEPEVGCEP